MRPAMVITGFLGRGSLNSSEVEFVVCRFTLCVSDPQLDRPPAWGLECSVLSSLAK